MPVTWAEVEATVRTGEDSDLGFGPRDVLRLVDAEGDRFGPLLELRQHLPSM